MELLTEKESVIDKFKFKIVEFWQSLSLPEKLYSVSLVLIILQQSNFSFSALLTLIGLTLEFWPKFSRAWESLAGKAIILLFYATITNFALATSANIVNEVTGVSANFFDYTHNFTILMILPSWVLGISAGMLLIFQLVVPFYLTLLLLVKPFGIKITRLFSKSNHPFFSNLLRFSVSFILLFQLMSIQNGEHFSFSEKQSETLTQALPDTSLDEGSVIALSDSTNNNDTTPSHARVKIGGIDYSTSFNIPSDANYHDIIRTFVAVFAYEFEAESNSRCKKPKDTKVVELNDFEVLFINENQEAKYGYEFKIAICDSPAASLYRNGNF